jgi:succinyl-CoA synthetase beta subunit
MEIFEYQAKGLLRKLGVPVPVGRVAYLPEEAAEAARLIGGAGWVVKAQLCPPPREPLSVLGLQHCAATPEQAAETAGHLLESTSRSGAAITRVYVEQALNVRTELSLAIGFDRPSGSIVCAGQNGQRAAHVPVDVATGLAPRHGRAMAYALGLSSPEDAGAMGRFLRPLYDAMVSLDALSIEADPAVVTTGGAMLAAEARIAFDDNARFRHPEIEELREEGREQDAGLAEAARQQLGYVRLSGNVGCIGNGAGLTLAGMDLIRRYGGLPASFLDVGGAATREQVAAALRLLLAEPRVEGILVCIFGGLVRCDVIAEGLVAAVREAGVQMPLVVRLAGTNADLGQRILRDSGLPITASDSLDSAAAEVVKAVREYA